MATWRIIQWITICIYTEAQSTETCTSPSCPYTIEKAVWLDEGIAIKGTLQEYEEQRTFCFYENATLRIRLDPLNSTLQPFIVQKFGQSAEAHAIYSFLGSALDSAQRSVWILRRLLWSWTQLRVIVRSTKDVESIQVSYSRKPGPICSYILRCDNAFQELKTSLPPLLSSSTQMALGILKFVLCENCVQQCPLRDGFLMNDTRVFTLSPYHAPCITLKAPSKRFFRVTSSISQPYLLSFYAVLSSLYIQNFITGLVLYYASRKLAQSRSFHYCLGATAAICFSGVLAFYVISRQSKTITRLMPGFQFIQSLVSIMSLALPITGFVLVPSLYRLYTYALDFFAYVWRQSSFFGIPFFGRIYFIVFGLLGCILVWWNQWGATPANLYDPESAQDDEEIDTIGKLDIDAPLTSFQNALSRLLQCMGLIFLFYSTSSTEISIIIIILVLLTRVFEVLASIAYFWYHYEKPGKHSSLISAKEYQYQAKVETEKALKALRKYIQANPDTLDRVKEENETRLRRFAKGRNHIEQSIQFSNRTNNRRKWSCILQ